MPSRRNALIWAIDTKETGHTSYVMGTMHVRDQRAYKAFELAQSLLQKVDCFLSEVDLDKLQEQDSIFSTMLPPGVRLQDLLGKKYAKVRRMIHKAFGVDILLFDQQMPIVLVNMISESILQSDQAVALDFGLWQSAKELDVETGGIETIEEHADTLSRISLDEQVKMLVDVSSDVSKFRKKVQHLAELYSLGEIHRLYQLSKKDLGALKTDMLYRRNQIMCDRVLDIHQSCPVFLAVGAGHLSGEKGVLHLIRRSGAMIRPVF